MKRGHIDPAETERVIAEMRESTLALAETGHEADAFRRATDPVMIPFIRWLHAEVNLGVPAGALYGAATNLIGNMAANVVSMTTHEEDRVKAAAEFARELLDHLILALNDKPSSKPFEIKKVHDV